MKNISLFAGAWMVSMGIVAPALAGTDSVKMTFESVIEAGTCTAQIQSSAGAAISELDFGTVYKSDLSAKSRVEPFKLVFSSCSGVAKAKYTAKPSSGSSCSGPSFAGTGTAEAVAVELWKGQQDSGTALACNTSPEQDIDVKSGGGSVDMNARMVVAPDRNISDVTTGDTSIPVTFAVTYE